MKSNHRKHSNGKNSAIIALAVVLVLTIALGVLGVTGMPLDSRGLWRLMPWLPTTSTSSPTCGFARSRLP